MAEHVIKVQPPYWDALVDGSKPFEVRRNDRAYQRGDVLRFVRYEDGGRYLVLPRQEFVAEVSFVYSGDPRWGGIEPGFVVLGLVGRATAVPGTTEKGKDHG